MPGGKKGVATSEPYPTKKNSEKQPPIEQEDENVVHINEDAPNHEGQTKSINCINNKDDGMVDYTCVTCNDDVGEDGIECEWCYNWKHRSCAELSQS